MSWVASAGGAGFSLTDLRRLPSPSLPSSSPALSAAAQPTPSARERFRTPDDTAVTALAKRLGISEDAIRRQRMAGKSLAEIAHDHGVSREEAVAVVSSALSGDGAQLGAVRVRILAEFLVGRDPHDDEATGHVSPALVRQWMPASEHSGMRPRT